MTTTEGNKLIAEFMGWHFESAFSDVNTTRYNRWITPHSPAWTTNEQMVFHSSWDWLVPACKKWSFLEDSVVKYNSEKFDDLCHALDDYVTLYDITVVFNQLVENIQWYNQASAEYQQANSSLT